MSVPATNFTIRFNIATGKFNFSDTTNYSGAGIALSDVAGVFKIVGAGGTVYENVDFGNPDISPNSSLNFNTVSLPLDSDGNVVKGGYNFIYSIQVSGGVSPGTYTKEIDYDYGFTAPTVKIGYTANCLGAQLTSIDQTDYNVDSVAPSIDRTHIVRFQDSTKSPDSEGSAVQNIISYPYFYTGIYATTISTDLIYDEGGGVSISLTVEGSKTFSADCDQSLCSVSCGIINLNNNYKAALKPNPTLAAQYWEKLKVINLWVQLFDLAIRCGKDSTAAQALVDIKEAGGFTDDCCGSGGVTQVIPLSSPSNIVEVQEGDGITVSSSSGGGVTTYTVQIEETLKAKIDNLTKVILAAGAGISITPVTSGYTTTYTIAYSGAVVVQPNIYSTKFTLVSSTSPTFPNISAIDADTQVYGDVFKTGTGRAPAIVAKSLNGSVTSLYRISDFKSVSGTAKVFNVILSNSQTGAVAGYRVQVYAYSTDWVDIFFLDSSGSALTYTALVILLNLTFGGNNTYINMTLIAEPS